MSHPQYQEYAPSAHLAQRIECFWSMRTAVDLRAYPVMPDGCVDILFARQGNGRTEITVVGAMTRRRDFAIPAGRFQFGIRFRPGMGRTMLRAPVQEITDCVVALEDLWGAAARRLEEQLSEAGSVGQAIARAEKHLRVAPPLEPLERAAAWLIERRGQVSVEELAENAGVSTRQFRRLCLDASGLTPKRLARVLRFRHVLELTQRGRGMDWAQVALESGCYDQAHLINEFQEFAATTPSEYAASVTIPRSAAQAAD